ncbi:MAG: N-6 DNA methylase [Chloroflexi bacterium]|nr:N-6 DNA methylase [Chloroflexota bacterium]
MTTSLAGAPIPRLPATPAGKSLFSRYYLETHLPQHPEWAEDPRPTFARLRELWERGRRLGATWNENQTETEFLRPVLDALGWAFIPQAAATRGGRLNRPDYALFRDAAARDQAYPLQGQDDAFYGRSLAIAEAKHWGRPLSHQSADGREQWDASTNPSHQMVNYLVGTRCPWGILTNGQVWRLYSREVSSTASEFYEVDLGLIFDFLPPDGEPTPEQLGAFKLWWLFFRRDAFVPDAQGRHFGQRVAAGSATYAREVSDKLKDLVYREVMPGVAAGFIAYRRERLGIAQETDATLAEIYRASLGLLYKLLFILYAEARGLLPVDNPAYHAESLTRMAAEFADKRQRGQPLSDATHAARQYDSLLALFHRIDLGDPDLGIPRYDGGLFNPATPENRFLEAHRLSDRVVARAVEILVYDAGEPVDYGYISVRNLGSIYEGLLENRLVLTSPPHPLSSQERGPGDEVTLVNDRGERKATGSYYTPDYIVNYIVRQTLGPVLDERQPAFEAAMARCAELRGVLAKTLDAGANRQLRGQLEAAEAAAREAFLGIKVCDPAMGSGHFLVNAVDFLTDGIIQRMQAYHDSHADVPWEWNPIQQLVARVRRDIIEEMARQGISLDPARLDDTSLLTRLVMKRCIYGVDLNRMAVELAKLSLWLHSFTVGAPLSFLDHHLRWGNSLIGSDVRTVEAAMQGQTQVKKVSEASRRLAQGRKEQAREAASGFQFDLFGGPFAGLLELTTTMLQIAGRSDATLADVRQSADEFDRFQRELTPYKQVLDLWVSRHFGNAAADELLTVHGGDVLPALRGERALAETYQAAIERAKTLWEEKRFFHWDLEFPEVFVDLARRDWAENPGFDAVISNPPYVDIKGLPKEFVNYLFDRYSTARQRINVFAVFLEASIRATRSGGGQVGFIIPTAFLTQVSYAALRSVILENHWLESVVRLPNEIFGQAAGEVKVDTCVVVIQTGPLHIEPSTKILVYGSFERANTISTGTADKVFEYPQREWLSRQDATITMMSGAESGIVSKMQRNAVKLEDCCTFCLGLTPYDKYSGHTPEQIKNRVFHATAQVDPTYRKLLESGDVRRYEVVWNGGNWISYGDWLAAPREQRFFTEERILVQQIVDWSSLRLFAGLTEDELYNSQNQFNLLRRGDVSLKFVLAVLNSSVMSYYHRRVFLDAALQRFQKVLIRDAKQFPIPPISFTTPAAERARLAEEGCRLYEQFGAASDAAPVLNFVEHHLAQGQSDVVHDLLAYLAERMIAMNREKQAEVKGFLAWLSRETGANINTLNNKTRVQAYLGDYQKGEPHATLEELLDILRQNRRKLAVDPSGRAFQERLAVEYEASLGKLLPIKGRLAATDRLIDQVVYRLYGLTEEEVAVVEGKK